jgi:TetR/AcrR family transcriptional regulator, transcriptional repressor for nem operon
MARPASYDRDTALASAMTLFWEKGFHATSLKDLETALQMKSGSIYAAFHSKERLFQLSLQTYFEGARAAFRSEMAAASSPLKGLADHIRSYANLPEGHPHAKACMLIKTVMETQATEPALAAQAREYLAAVRDEIAAVFEQAKEQNIIQANEDTNLLARRFQANMNALRIELHQGTEKQHIVDLASDMARDIENLKCDL